VRRILVTGASGFVGGYLLPVLQRDFPEAELHATAHGAMTPSDEVRWHRLDLLEAEAVQALIGSLRPDVVIHLAAQSNVALSFREPELTWRVNLEGTLHLQRALASQGRCLLIQVGSADMYGASFLDGVVDEQSLLQPLNPYAASKAAADLAAFELSRTSEVQVIRARPFNHTGAGQSDAFVVSGFARQIAETEAGLREPVITTGDLSAERDFLHVADVAEAYTALIQKGAGLESGSAVNICSGEAVAVSTVLDELISLSSVPLERRVDPEKLRKSDIPRVQGRAALLQSETGWARRISRRQMLSSVLDYWRGVYGAKPEKRG